MNDIYNDVLAFHRKMGCTVADYPLDVNARDQSLIEQRCALLLEEYGELVYAIRHEDAERVAQEIADVVYVAVGCAVALGVPFDDVWRAVHRSNMAKSPHLQSAGGKILKPKGWVGPSRAIEDAVEFRRSVGLTGEEARRRVVENITTKESKRARAQARRAMYNLFAAGAFVGLLLAAAGVLGGVLVVAGVSFVAPG